jgi:Spy/CpxP family protein refolding chaperone
MWSSRALFIVGKEKEIMKKVWLCFITLIMACLIGTGVVCGEGTETDPHHGYSWKSGHVSGHGSLKGHGPGCDAGKKPHRWDTMTDEQKDLYNKIVASFNAETLEVRQQLAVKQLELETLWSQEEVDEARVEKLSNEVADLKARLWKMHDQYVLKCRKTFGAKGWDCPGHAW